MRLLGGTFSLHDIRDVEVFVRSLLDRRLRETSATLDRDKYNRALSDLVSLTWELSGLTPSGRRRYVRYVRVAIATPIADDEVELRLGRIGPLHDVDAALAMLEALRRKHGPQLWRAHVEIVRPRGAYDRSKGLSFSTYATQTLGRRVVDWFRGELGDNRYEQGRVKTQSLDVEHDVLAWSEDVAELLTLINRDALTPESLRVLEQVVVPMEVEGKTMEQIAQHLGCNRQEIRRRLARLKDELELQQVAA